MDLEMQQPERLNLSEFRNISARPNGSLVLHSTDILMLDYAVN